MDVEPYNKIWSNYFLPIAVDSRCQSLEYSKMKSINLSLLSSLKKHAQRQVKMKQTKKKKK